MNITYLGQAGWLFDTGKTTVMIDPYLSDSCRVLAETNHRRVPVDERFLRMKPDLLVFTHNHQDHYDPETAEQILAGDTAITVLCPTSVWQVARKLGGPHNYVCFDRHTRWTQGGVRLTAVKAEHSDPYAIGVLIDDGRDVYYVSGDTLYNTEVLADLPKGLKAAFFPINGRGNNMNVTDAMAFAEATGARYAVPCHVGMMDDMTADGFVNANRVVPVVYQTLELAD